MKLKKCPKCGRIMPVNMFAPNTDKCKLCRRDYDWQYRHNITPDEYYDLWKEQGGKCKICGRTPKDDEYLHVDHDHNTGKIRGLLCRECNLGLGNFKDNPKFLTVAAKYVEEK